MNRAQEVDTIHEKSELGRKGERIIKHYLEKQGFIIRAMNYRERGGEIDLIAQKDEILAFVEVKLRRSAYFNISEVIIPAKQRKIIKTASLYIARNKFRDTVYRFDVALLEHQGEEQYIITYLPNAFTAPTYP